MEVPWPVFKYNSSIYLKKSSIQYTFAPVSLTVYYTIKPKTTAKNVFFVWCLHIDVVCVNLWRSAGEASQILGLSIKWW
jgi:hypothetical protein